MNSFARPVPFAVALLLATSAHGDLAWRSDLGAALAEGAALGRPVLADFTADWCGFCKKLDAETFSDSKVASSIRRDFVAVKVDADQYPDLVQQYEVQGFPTLLVLRPDGSAAHSIVGFVDAETMLKELRSGRSAVGPLAPLEEFMRIQRDFESASKAFERGRYGSAFSLFERVAKADEELEEVSLSKERMSEIEAMATERLENALASRDAGEFRETARLLDELVRAFDGAPAAKEGRRLRTELLRDPEARMAIREAEATELLERSQQDLDAGEHAIAATRLEGLIEEYGDLSAAEPARAMLGKLTSDPQLRRKIEDQRARSQCRVWLSLASTWSKNRRPERAREYYRKIVATFPDSSYAEEAREKLNGIR